MGFLDFLFGKKNTDTTNNSRPQQSVQASANRPAPKPASDADQPKPVNIAALSNGAPFSIKSKSVKVVKQYYNGQQEEIPVGSGTAEISRATMNGPVNIVFSDLATLRSNNIIQSNQSFNPEFAYNKDEDGNEFASAEVGNSFAHISSGKEFVSLLQITKQKGRVVSFIINNLPNEGDFYYLIMFN